MSFENSQATENRQTGILQRGKLTCERTQLFAADAADRKSSRPLLFLRRWLFLAVGLSFRSPLSLGRFFGLLSPPLLGDLGDKEAFFADLRLGLLLRGCVDGVLHLETRIIHRFILKGRHRPSPIKFTGIAAKKSSYFIVSSSNRESFPAKLSGFVPCLPGSEEFLFIIHTNLTDSVRVKQAILGFSSFEGRGFNSEEVNHRGTEARRRKR